MVGILVIEDEAIERETLVNILYRSFSEIEVYSAKNGVEAIELYDKKKPSIVLADINIPQISGLEVIRKIKSYGEACEFLIVSSYNYFHYAQEAIRLGVEDFILKPYAIDHLVQAVEQAIEKLYEKKDEEQRKTELLDKLEKYTPVMESECFYAILSNRDEFEVKRALRLLNEKLKAGFCLVASNKEERDVILSAMKEEFYQVLHQQVHDTYVCFVLMEKWPIEQQQEQLKQKFAMWMEQGYHIQIGSIQQDSSLYASYVHALSNSLAEFAIPQQIKEEGLSTQKLLSSMQQAFEDMEEEKVRVLIQSYTTYLLGKNKDNIKTDIGLFMDSLLIYLKDHQPEINVDACPEVLITNNVHQEIAYYLNVHIMRYYQAMVDDKFKNANQLVRQAMKYIDSNYKRPITLNDLAQALDVSPFYISKLLNNTMKKTFTELVSEKRVEVSKELLKTNKRIKEIAYEVGFQGQNYFTKIFKKYTGVTPKVYKNTFEEPK